MKTILVTGGAGYAGSHTCVELLNNGYQIIVVDNLCNSHAEAIRRVESITGRAITFYKLDVCDRAGLMDVFRRHSISAVIHFAGLKAVGESVRMPLEYYRNNLDSTMTLCDVMLDAGVDKFVFSSSATVYGTPDRVPIPEDAPLSANNPYGWTKFMNEQILRDLGAAHPLWSVILLRYFNPVGAHPSGLIGEDPAGIPNNLMPNLSQVAVGRLRVLHIFGNDYPTPDGTGIRDYIHVADLAAGHVKAVEYCLSHSGIEAINLGTGIGCSVLQMVDAFEKASGRKIPCQFDPRRPGDIAECFADPAKALRLLGWKAERGISEMCADAWRWQKNNPDGYGRLP
jgi:UDP-glucose 4-epimerase